MEEIAEILEKNMDFVGKLVEMLADKELDLELEFDDMTLELEDFELKLSGKTTLSAQTKDVKG